MKFLKLGILAFCLSSIGQAIGQDTGPVPDRPSKEFAAPHTGPKCGELEGIGRSLVDGCMEKAVGDRPACVDAGKKKFMGLLMNKYGIQCRFVGEIIGRYAQTVGLEVGDKVPKPDSKTAGDSCQLWEDNAKKVIGECGRRPQAERKTCGLRAVDMFIAAVQRDPEVFKRCPSLEPKIGAMADAAFGKELSNELGKEAQKGIANSKDVCKPIFDRFRGGIDKCASASNPGPCLIGLKGEFDKLISEPKNSSCHHVSDALGQYAYSKPSLRPIVDGMRGDRVDHHDGGSKAVAQSGGSEKVCREVETQAQKIVLGCSKLSKDKQMSCMMKAEPVLEQNIQRVGGCDGLKDRVGDYARSKGINLPGGPGPDKPVAVAPPITHGKLKVTKGQQRKCKKFIRWAGGAFKYCMKKKNQAQRDSCMAKSEPKIMNRKQQSNFGPETCPREHQRFEEMGDKLRGEY